MENMIRLDEMINILDEAKIDYKKFFTKGNKTAATRLRKKLQDVAKLCKESRKQVIEHKKTL
ncbi:MAG: histone H1 [bacterium]